jgi:hypothetical protein
MLVSGALVTTVTASCGRGLGAAELQGATHEVFAMKLSHGAAGFINAGQGHKGESLGALGAAVDHHLSVADIAHSAEEFEQVALGSVIGEIAYIEAIGGDFARSRG